MNDFKDKCVFVTGGAHGIGRSIVEAFRNAGARVAFCDLDRMQGEAAARDTGAAFYPADVADAAALRGVFDAVCERFGEIGILVNNAGISEFSPLADTAAEQFDRILAVNLRPVFVTAHGRTAQHPGRETAVRQDYKHRFDALAAKRARQRSIRRIERRHRSTDACAGTVVFGI